MSVFLRNLQKRVIFDSAILIRDTSYLMQLLKVDKFDVGVVCTGAKLIKSLNYKYRKRNIQTDVLAFPYFEVSSLGTAGYPVVRSGPYKRLGERTSYCRLISAYVDLSLPGGYCVCVAQYKSFYVSV